MQSMLRFARPGLGSSLPQHNTEFYQPLNTGSGRLPFEELAEPDRCRWRPNTQGKAFNIVVGWVILANAIVIGLETDMGLFGFGTPGWTALDHDMSGAHVDGARQNGVKILFNQIFGDDRAAKGDLQQFANNTFHVDIDFRQGFPAGERAAYTLVEYLFVLFYVVELCMRFCDQGCKKTLPSFCCRAIGDGWKILDISVVFLGILDLGLALVLGHHPSLSATRLLALLRTTRVLRILRLFRVCHELKILGGAYRKAFWAVLWVGALILVINFVIAVLLTSLIGQKTYLWGEKKDLIESWFGSVGRSMQTLFTIMTLSGWDNIANELSEVIPGTIVMPAIVLYIMLCCFTMASLVMGVISDSFLTAQREEEKDIALKRQKHWKTFEAILRTALESCDPNKTGRLKRDAYTEALEAHPDVLANLKLFDVHGEIDDFKQIHDRLSPDSGSDGGVSIEMLVEAIPLVSRPAQASGVFDVKNLLLATRRDAVQRSSEAQQQGSRHHLEQTNLAKKTAQEVTDARSELAMLQQEVVTVRQELASLHDKVATLRQEEEKHQQDAAQAMSTVHSRLDALAAQIAVQASVPGKLDALAVQLSHQEEATKKVDGLATQFAAQFAAQFATQFVMANGKGVGSAAVPPEYEDNAEVDNKTVEEIAELDPDASTGGEPSPGAEVQDVCYLPVKPQQSGDFAAADMRQPSQSSEPESTMATEKEVPGKDPEHTPTCKENGMEDPAETGNLSMEDPAETGSSGGAPDEAAASTSGR